MPPHGCGWEGLALHQRRRLEDDPRPRRKEGAGPAIWECQHREGSTRGEKRMTGRPGQQPGSHEELCLHAPWIWAARYGAGQGAHHRAHAGRTAPSASASGLGDILHHLAGLALVPELG